MKESLHVDLRTDAKNKFNFRLVRNCTAKYAAEHKTHVKILAKRVEGRFIKKLRN